MNFMDWILGLCAKSVLLNYIWAAPFVSAFCFYKAVRKEPLRASALAGYLAAGCGIAALALYLPGGEGAFPCLKNFFAGWMVFTPCCWALSTPYSRKEFLFGWAMLLFVYPWEPVLSPVISPLIQGFSMKTLASASAALGLDAVVTPDYKIVTGALVLSITPACAALGVHIFLAFTALSVSWLFNVRKVRELTAAAVFTQLVFFISNQARMTVFFTAGNFGGTIKQAEIVSAVVFFSLWLLPLAILMTAQRISKRKDPVFMFGYKAAAVMLCILVLLSSMGANRVVTISLTPRSQQNNQQQQAAPPAGVTGNPSGPAAAAQNATADFYFGGLK